MKKIKGDLIEKLMEGEFDLIIHGCNCFCTMNSGIAGSLRKKYPFIYEADCKTIKGDQSKLGTISYDLYHKPLIINCYTQYNYGRDSSKIYVSYDAVRSCMKLLKTLVELNFDNNLKIGIPKIGAGLANGDWTVIEKIIDDELSGLNVTLVELI